MTTASLELSKKIYELIGEHETEKIWTKPTTEEESPVEIFDRKDGYVLVGRWSNAIEAGFEWLPSPSFSELIRTLPKIGERAKWRKIDGVSVEEMAKLLNMKWQDLEVGKLAELYMSAPTEPEGMKAVENYLLPLL